MAAPQSPRIVATVDFQQSVEGMLYPMLDIIGLVWCGT